jgi:hypothetical protein
MSAESTHTDPDKPNGIVAETGASVASVCPISGAHRVFRMEKHVFLVELHDLFAAMHQIAAIHFFAVVDATTKFSSVYLPSPRT